MTVDNCEEFILVITIFVVNAPGGNQTDDNLVIVSETAGRCAVIAADPQTIVAEEVGELWVQFSPSLALLIVKLYLLAGRTCPGLIFCVTLHDF